MIRTTRRSTSRLRSLVLAGAAALLALGASPPTAVGWGCDGHQIVALIAQEHLQGSPAAAAASKLLSDHPIDPGLSRFCAAARLGPFVDAATWADDFRDQHPETGEWHFLDIPRGETKPNAGTHCPAAGCITRALADQMRTLNAPAEAAAKRADALRFVIHFAGDVHQPLHIVTNNDRGGNCVPVAFFGAKPVLTDPSKGSYKPNLHGVWDTSLIARMLTGSSAATLTQFASGLKSELAAKQASWQAAGLDFDAWAWESHVLAESPGYRKLPRRIAVETPQPVNTCNDANQVSTRLLALKESVAAGYEKAAAPVIREQLAKAGFRLAQLLRSVTWP